ncbi:MAG TPA: zinc-binding dehydrogenase [Thermoanaerobaculia bacterium]|nr:zinc-binding dehydrogenase [Thermoanaerobaculia bacterium]
MKAAIIAASRNLRVVDSPKAEPAGHQIRVRLEGCGVCASNLPVWEGRPWFSYPLESGAPGHEGWGVVDSVGQHVDDVRPGDRVAFLSNRAYAEFDVTDAWVRLPPELDGRRFPGEALGCAMNIFRRADIRDGQTVAVIGAGWLGNLVIQLAKSAGAHVIAISRRESARDIARACGADGVLSLDEAAGIGNIERVIECVGAQNALDVAAQIIGERGRLVIAGYHQDGLRQIDMQKWNWLGIDVINAHERNPRNYLRGIEEAIDAVIAGRIDPEPLLTHTYALDELDRALNDVAERPGNFIKGAVLF